MMVVLIFVGLKKIFDWGFVFVIFYRENDRIIGNCLFDFNMKVMINRNLMW